jgi:integrase
MHWKPDPFPQTPQLPEVISLEAEKILPGYENYLSQVLGLAVSTQKKHLKYMRRFLSTLSEEPSGGCTFTLEKAIEFVEFPNGVKSGRSGRATAVRSFLRFLIARGAGHPNLPRAILVPRRHRDKSLPAILSQEEIQRILSTSPRETATQRRNLVIFLLLARLGLRGGEIRELRLEDIDWVRSEIRIGSGKSRRERRYPMSQEIGEAISGYIRNDRPQSESQAVFPGHRPPFGPLLDNAVLSKIVAKCLRDLGIREHGGSHLFRHSAASQLVCQGLSFKEVSDLLGHQFVQTTFIYAKLDLQALSSVALPWPGGA